METSKRYVNTSFLIATITIVMFLCLAVVEGAEGNYYLDDGDYHLINDNRYEFGYLYLDSHIANNPGTYVEWANGASLMGVETYNNSSLKVNGGNINGELYSYNNSKIEINAGSVYSLNTHDNSSVDIQGGNLSTSGGAFFSHDNSTINMRAGLLTYLFAEGDSTINFSGGESLCLFASQNSIINVTGGFIQDDPYYQSGFSAGQTATIYLYGSNFTVNGQALNYGDNLRDYGTLSYGELIGRISGTLLDGSTINNNFSMDTTANIIVIPEPTTLLLLTLGGLVLRKKH